MTIIKRILTQLLPGVVVLVLAGLAVGYFQWQSHSKQLAQTVPTVGNYINVSTEQALSRQNGTLLQQSVEAALKNNNIQAITVLGGNGYQLLQEGVITENLAQQRFKNTISTAIIYYRIPNAGLYLAGYGTAFGLIGALLFGPLVLKSAKEAKQIKYGFEYSTARLLRPTETLKNEQIELPDYIVGNFKALESAIDEQLDEHITSEAQLHGMQEVTQEANKAKTRFLAQMTHEIRTPINGVLGMIDLLLDSNLNPQQARLAGTAKNSGVTLLNIINDLLDFAKMDAGRMDRDSSTYNLRDVVEGIVELVSANAYSKGVEVGSFIDPDVPLMLEGDDVKIRQILANLAGNAVKYTSKGEVGIYVKIQKTQNKKIFLNFSVRDTGMGIAEADKKHIFQAFSQGRDEDSKRRGGTGLGLSIASQLASVLGGELELDSQVNVGSTFHFTIPQKQAEQTEASFVPATINKAIVAANANITQQSLEAYLKILGVTEIDVVDKYAETSNFLRKAASRNQPYDLIFTDINLKDAEGEQLLNHLQSDASIGNTGVVLMSAAASLTSIGGYVNTEKIPVLMKPIKLVELQQSITDALLAKEKVASYTLNADIQNDVAKTVAVESPEAVTAAQQHILIAEDNPVNAEVTKSMLENAGYKATVVENGKLAVEAIQNEAYDAILMDGQMPEMDGLEATILIREFEETFQVERTPIIAVTANKVESIKAKYLREGMDDFITKPFDKEFLVSTIQKYLPAVEAIPASKIRFDKTTAVNATPQPVSSSAAFSRSTDSIVNKSAMVRSSRRSEQAPSQSSVQEIVENLVETAEPVEVAQNVSPVKQERKQQEKPQATPTQQPTKQRPTKINIDDHQFSASAPENNVETSTSTNPVNEKIIKILQNPNSPAIHLDKTALANIRALQPEDAKEFMEKIVGIFIKDTEASIDLLYTAADTKDLQTISRTGHKIKSSSASIGALELSKIAYWLEKYAAQEPENVGPNLHALQNEFDEVQELLAEEIAA